MTKRRDVERLIEETRKDLEAFEAADACIRRRRLEREADGILEEFSDWPGTMVVENALIMVRVRCEGLIEDLRRNLDSMPRELELVKGDTDE